jgi:hypothetical protein
MADESGILENPPEYENPGFQEEEKKLAVEPSKELRHLFGRFVKSVKTFIVERHEKEIKNFLDVYRGDVERILPARVLNFDNVDVNVVFPVIKTLIPSLYFQDPKVYIKAEQEKVVIEHKDPATGNPILDQNGMPQITEFSAVESATKFQAKLNDNIRKAKLKREMKSCLTDAELGFYGAMKVGWGNEQGVETMGDGAPPSHRDDTDMDMAYGIRLRPWKVFVDMNDFYHPQWIAVAYEDHPSRLKEDKRLQNTENLKGNCEAKEDFRKEIWKDMATEDLKRTEYFEFYHKPCAQYPNGIFAIFTDEVADDFLYFGEWPYSQEDTRKTFPIKIIYFNEDPEGNLPVPGVRYYIQQQRAKSILRRVMYEYVQRTIPMLGLDRTKLDETGKQAIASGRLPRIFGVNGNPNSIIAPISFNNLNQDFYNMDLLIDDDVNRMVGVADSGGRGANVKFAEVAKQAQANQQIRNSEKADIVRDFMIDIVRFWAGLFQEFGGQEMSTPVEGSQFPVNMSVDEIQAKFSYDIKPFSMNYEDPMILRRQWVDLLNMGIAPANVQALAAQGAQLDVVKLWKRTLLTYDDPETHSYIIQVKPEDQVADAISENQAILAGQPVEILPTDNDQIHLMVHGTMPDAPGKLEHMLAHQQKMLEAAGMGGKGGGGNKEGLPTNGSAANQEMLQNPLTPSAVNTETAMTREAMNPIETR